MTTTDRRAAQRRVEQIAAFQRELAALRAEGAAPFSDDQIGAVTAHQAAILARLDAAHDIDRSPASARLSRGLQLASLFGAVTLTAGVSALVERYWGLLSAPAQVSLLAVCPLAALACVEAAARRERTLYMAGLFALVAYGTCWLAIVGMSDALGVPVQPPALWLGVAFGLALSAAYGFRPVLAASLVALAVAAGASTLWLGGRVWTAVFERLEPLGVAGAGLLFFAPRLDAVAPGFAATTRLVGLVLFYAAALVLSMSGEPSLLPFSAPVTEATFQVIVLVTTIAGIVVGLRAGWRETWITAATALFLFLLTRYVDWFWDAVPRYAFFLILAGLTFVTLSVLGRVRARLTPRSA